MENIDWLNPAVKKIWPSPKILYNKCFEVLMLVTSSKKLAPRF